MNYSNLANLSILACPGGEIFADEVIRHLKKIYHHKQDATVAELVRRYGIDREEAIRRIDFINDAAPLIPFARQGESKQRSPRFKTPVRFVLFPNGEIKAEILESIRGKDIYLFQDVENRYPLPFNDGSVSRVLTVNDHLMSIFVAVDAVKQAGAGRVTLALPTYPYSRQHKRKGREGLTASRVGGILESLGADRIITLDIHSREIVNAFRTISLENLHASYQIIRALSGITDFRSEDLVVLAPDTGAVDRNKFYATALKKPLALLYKERDYSRVSRDAMENNIAEIKLLGDVSGKTVFMADDMLGTGGTLLKAMKFLRDQGARQVIAAISLPVFSGNAVDHFDQAYRDGLFYRIIGTNAIYHEELLKREWYLNVDISKLFAQAVSRLHQGLSLSSLLDNRDIITRLLADDPSS
jgi:ribose-phosphate pyrophosphokinase